MIIWVVGFCEFEYDLNTVEEVKTCFLLLFSSKCTHSHTIRELCANSPVFNHYTFLVSCQSICTRVQFGTN